MKRTLLLSTLSVVFFFAFAFGEGNINPLTWHEASRAMCAFAMVCPLAIACIGPLIDND